MKKIFCLWFVVLSISFAQEGKIFNYSFSYTGDVNNNLDGGIKKGTTYMGNIHTNFMINTAFLGLDNGNFSIDIMNSHGNKFSEQYVGDMQILSNIENDPSTIIYELWYSYNYGNLTAKIGYIDLNSDFIIMKSAETFMNSSLQVFPSLSLNYPLSIFPRPNFGLHFDYNINENNILRFGYFDVEQTDNAKLMLNTKLFKDDQYNVIVEYQHTDDKYLAKIGGLYHNRIDNIKNIISFYGGVDYKFNDKINIFAQIGINTKNNLTCNNYFAIGLVLNSPFGTENDHLGFAYGYTSLYKKSNEAFAEIYYFKQLFDIIYLQPDIQYIINPSGYLNDALVFNLRIGLEL